jgi:hypothetical protein
MLEGKVYSKEEDKTHVFAMLDAFILQSLLV